MLLAEVSVKPLRLFAVAILAALVAFASVGHAQAKKRPAKPAAAAQSTPEPAALVDLNTASKADLMTLPGISDGTAEKIIAARPYNQNDELVSKRVVEAAVFAKIKNAVVSSVHVVFDSPTTIHLGQTAALQLPVNRRIIGSAGEALELLREDQDRGVTTYLFRAVAIGDERLITSPPNLQEGDCASCATVQYLVKVVQ
jgi:hypothetical protein